MRTAPVPVVPDARLARNEWVGMPLGLGVSGGVHVAVIVSVLFGGELFVARNSHQFQVTEVSLVSVSEFGALLSEAPDIPATEAQAATQPDVVEELQPPQLPVARPVQRPEPATAPTTVPPPPVSPTTVAALADSESPIPQPPTSVATPQPAIPEVPLETPKPTARTLQAAAPPPEPASPVAFAEPSPPALQSSPGAATRQPPIPDVPLEAPRAEARTVSTAVPPPEPVSPATFVEPSPPVRQSLPGAVTRQPVIPDVPREAPRPEARAVPTAVPPPEPVGPAVVAALTEPSPPARQFLPGAATRQPTIPDVPREAPRAEARTVPPAVLPPEPAGPAVVAALAESSPRALPPTAVAPQLTIPVTPPAAPTPQVRTVPAVPPAPAAEPKAKPSLAAMLSAILQSGTEPLRGIVTGRGFLNRKGLSASEYNYLRRRISSCWNTSTVVGGRNAHELQVTLQVDFTQDGYLRGDPRLVEPNPLPSEHHHRAYQAAKWALQRCAPYTRLPADEYARWRRLNFTFDPSGMVGGAQ